VNIGSAGVVDASARVASAIDGLTAATHAIIDINIIKNARLTIKVWYLDVKKQLEDLMLLTSIAKHRREVLNRKRTWINK
jgi:hypothetical protein